MRFTPEETATILAGLRCWQRTLIEGGEKPPEWDIANNEGTVEPLSEKAIGALCERINFEPTTADVELYVCPGGEVGEGDHPGRIFLCRPGVDDNVAECFETEGVTAQQAGERLANSVNAVTRIVAALNEEPEWDSDTMSSVANILHEEGFTLREADEEGDE